MPKEKSNATPQKRISRQQNEESKNVSSNFNGVMNPTTLRPFNVLDQEGTLQIQLDWDTSYLQRMIGLDTDIDNLKKIWKQMQHENDYNSLPAKPCVTESEKVKTKILDSSNEKLAKKNRIKNVTKNQIKKHSCVNIPSNTMPATQIKPKQMSAKRPTVKPLKFEEIHPNLELISTNGRTIFPRRAQKDLKNRTSRTDPGDARHPKFNQNKISTWHDMLKQCTVEDVAVKLQKSDSKILEKAGSIKKNEHKPSPMTRQLCDIQILPPLNIERECVIQKLPSLALESINPQPYSLTNTKFYEVVHETPKKIPQPRSYQSDQIHDIYIKEPENGNFGNPETQFTSTKTMIIIDSMSDERNSLGTTEKMEIFEDTANNFNENIVICQDDLVKINDDGKFEFDRKVKINSCKDNLVTNQNDRRKNNEIKDKVQSNVPKIPAKDKVRKKRRSCKRIVPDSSSGEENNSPMMNNFGLNPKKIIDLIADVFESSSGEFGKDCVEEENVSKSDSKHPEESLYSKTIPNLPENDDMIGQPDEYGLRNSVINVIQNIREKIQILGLENSQVLKDVIGDEQQYQMKNRVKDTCSCLHCNHKMNLIPAACQCPSHHVSYSCPAHCMHIFSSENVASKQSEYHSNVSSECTSSSSQQRPSSRFLFNQTQSNVPHCEPLPSQRYKNIKKLLTESGRQDNRISKTINSIYESAKQYDKHRKDDTFIQKSYEDDHEIQMAAEKFLKSVEKQRAIENLNHETLVDANEICTQSSTTITTNSGQITDSIESPNNLQQLLCTNSEASNSDASFQGLSRDSYSLTSEDFYISSVEYHISRLKTLDGNPSKTSLTSDENF